MADTATIAARNKARKLLRKKYPALRGKKMNRKDLTQFEEYGRRMLERDVKSGREIKEEVLLLHQDEGWARDRLHRIHKDRSEAAKQRKKEEERAKKERAPEKKS